MGLDAAGTWKPLGTPTKIRLGDIDTFTIRWARAENDDGKCRWVDFAIYQVTMVEEDGRPLHPIPNAPSNMEVTDDIDKAGPLVEGFVKWDGCTQWSMPDGGHVDGRRAYEAFLDALDEARHVALTEIIDRDVVLDPEYDD